MAQRVIATAGTGAVVDGAQVAFSLHSKHFRNGQKPVLSVEGLGAGETISFWKWTNGDWEEAGSSSGQTVFTPTYATDVFNGPGTFGFTKTSTAAALTLTLDDGI